MAGKYPASSVYQMDTLKTAAKTQETFFVGGTLAKPQLLRASKVGEHDKDDELEKDGKKHGKKKGEESKAKPEESKGKPDESKAKAGERKKVKPEESKTTEATAAKNEATAKTENCDQSPTNTERPERIVKSNRKQGKGVESMGKAKTTETSPPGFQSMAADQKTKESAASTALAAQPSPAPCWVPPPTTAADPKTEEANQTNKCATSVGASSEKGVAETGGSSVVQSRPKPTHGTLNGASTQSVFIGPAGFRPIASSVFKPAAEAPAAGQQSVFVQATDGGTGGPQKQPAIPCAKDVGAQSVFIPGKP